MPYSRRRILPGVELLSGLLLLSFLCCLLFAESRNTKKEGPGKSQSTYSVKVNAVVVRAAVTDKSGNPVTTLTDRDFTIYDDGRPQKIQTFALESIDSPESQEAEGPDTSRSPKAKQGPPARPARLISILIDDLTMESPSQGGSDSFSQTGSILDYPRMVDAVKRFVKTDMDSYDQVTILSGSRNVQFPFTDNKRRILEELDTVPKKLNSYWSVRASGMSDYEAWMWANGEATEPIGKPRDARQQRDAEWKRIRALGQNSDIQSRTRNLLYTIRQHLRTLRHFEGAKMIVLFSDGFITQPGRLTGSAEARQLQELVDLALRSGIILNTVSTRGVSGEDVTKVQDPASGNPMAFNVPGEMNRLIQEQPLKEIASETGGEFFPRGNDMYIALKSIAHRRQSYYILTYAMPPHRPDGAYHKIKLEVTRPGLELSYRKGYYSSSEDLTFETTKKEDLMEALHGPGNMNEIPIALSYNFSRKDESSYAVSFLSHVNISGLQFPEEDSRRRNQVSLVLAAFDETGNFISGLEKAIDFQLLEGSYKGLRERGLTSRVELQLPMGHYTIKAVIRENAQGKMGSITRSIEIP